MTNEQINHRLMKIQTMLNGLSDDIEDEIQRCQDRIDIINFNAGDRERELTPAEEKRVADLEDRIAKLQAADDLTDYDIEDQLMEY